MTASDATGSAVPIRPALPEARPEAPVRQMPRLGRGVVWSDIVAEIERDALLRTEDAA
jgi:hypothetical protein